MTTATFLLRSLRYHWRSHLGVVLGATLATAILVGALLVGDSVRYSLERQALMRLGKTQFAIFSKDRFFGDRFTLGMGTRKWNEARALMLRGVVTTTDGLTRVNHVQVLGVDGSFGDLCDRDCAYSYDERAFMNHALASRLGAIGGGATIVVRLEKPSTLARDAPQATSKDTTLAARIVVKGIARDDCMGKFNLRNAQFTEPTLFVPIDWLQREVGLEGRINLLLGTQDKSETLTLSDINIRGREMWELTDAELDLRPLPQGRGFELRTDRVFLDPPVGEAVLKQFPESHGVLTYFVNEIRKQPQAETPGTLDARATPYSMVCASDLVAANLLRGGVETEESREKGSRLQEDEIILNSWVAEDLQAKVGDLISLKYFVAGTAQKLEERAASFRVRTVVPIAGAAEDPELMPKFPGLSDKENCRDWEPGVTVDLKRIRPKDEEYWKKHRGTPKAFITLAAGQKLWSNRFGKLTAIRWKAGQASGLSYEANRAALEKKIRDVLDPAWFGLTFQPVREQALRAARESQDFGQLFLGFSFFLILAALLLMGLLFTFGLEQRTEEIGTLLALGWTPRMVRRVFLWEGMALAALGGILGTVCGMAYTKAVLWGLATRWRSAISGTELWFHAEPMTLLIGFGASILLAMVVIRLGVRRMARRPARELLSGVAAANLIRGEDGKPRKSFAATGAVCAALMAIVLVAVTGRDTHAAEAFFGAGAFLLVAGILFCSRILPREGTRPTLSDLGLRNAARRRGRSLATVAMLACGVFLVIAVGANRQTPKDWQQGFAHLYAETTIPLVGDMNDPKVRGDFGMPLYFELHPKSFPGLPLNVSVTLVPMRLHEGDEASCLNLNHAQQPRLLAVKPQREGIYDLLEAEFTPLHTIDSTAGLGLLLDRQPGDDAVPAIGDEATVRWALGKKVGDTLDYFDEHGKKFPIRIVGIVANSVLQGSLVISEKNFVERFPSESGYRVFLLTTRADAGKMLVDGMNRELRDYGVEVRPAAERLAQFQQVENTYLSIFQALGGLGMLLGSVGMGVVVARNVMERRSELALMRAVGFSRRSLRGLVLSEHGFLLVLGLLTGMIAAMVAVWPALQTSWREVPIGSLFATVVAILISGFFWIWLAAGWALRGNLLAALRRE